MPLWCYVDGSRWKIDKQLCDVFKDFYGFHQNCLFSNSVFYFFCSLFHFDWFKCTTQNIYISLPSLSRVKKYWCLCFDCLLLFTIHISKFRLFKHSSNFLFNSQIPCYIPYKHKSIPILPYLILLNSIQTSKLVKNDITAECRRWINQYEKEQIK